MGIESWLDQQGVGLSFRVLSARMALKENPGEPGSRSISMRLALAQGDDVRLPDKRSLRASAWSIYVMPDNGDSTPEKREGVGFLSYHEAKSGDYYSFPEEGHINAVLKADSFNVLLQALQAGRVPDYVRIRARDLEYGWEPDGSGKEWNVSDKSQVLVTEASFGILFSRGPDEDDDDLENMTASGQLPPTKTDVRALCELIGKQTAATQSLKMTVIGVGAVIVALLLLS